MDKPFTHQVQWRRKGYWSPGSKFYSEEDAQTYGELRVNKGGEFRVVPIERHGELTTDQCLILMKCQQAQPRNWRTIVCRFLDHGKTPPACLTHKEQDALLDLGNQYPRAKLLKLNQAVLRGRLLMADFRERAKDIAVAVQDTVALDTNPEVMLIPQGAFVQAWVFVPNRSEEEEREHQHDIAAYLAGPPRADAA